MPKSEETIRDTFFRSHSMFLSALQEQEQNQTSSLKKSVDINIIVQWRASACKAGTISAEEEQRV